MNAAGLDRAHRASLGARLHKLRVERSFKVIDLARHLQCDPSSLYAIEKGRHAPSTTVLLRLARALRVEPLDLLTSPESSERHELIDLSRRLQSHQLALLLRRARGMVSE